jgi:hypothetical protein
MTLPFFITYLGTAFAGSLVLFTMVRKVSSHFAASGKRPTLYGVISALVAAGLSFFSTFISENLFWVFWILSGIYFVFGLIHHFLNHKRYFKAKPENRRRIMMAELMFCASIVLFTVVIFSALQYFVRDQEYLFFPMMLSTLSFFLPFLFFNTYETVKSIPLPTYTPWEYPLHNPIDLPDEDSNERLLVIGFEIAKRDTDTKATYFRAKAPEGIKLGELFYHFINDYNELQSETPIEFEDEMGGATRWLFRTKPKWYQSSRILNPNYNIRENGIKENTIIAAERYKDPQ